MTDTKGYPAFVISLSRTPERREAFFRENESAFPGITVFEAIDGNKVSRDDAAAQGIIGKGVHTYTQGAIGSAMSHRALWQQCAADREPMVVFEDDAILRRDFAERLPAVIAAAGAEWHIIRLGFNFDSILDVRMTDFCDLRSVFSIAVPSKQQMKTFAASQAPVHLFNLNNAFGICAYVISPRGARILLKRCFPLDSRLVHLPSLKRSVMASGTDYMMNAVYRDINAYVTVPPLALTPNDRSNSTIQRSLAFAEAS